MPPPLRRVAASAAAALLSATALAAPAAPPPTPPVAAPAPIEPEAMAAMDRMNAALMAMGDVALDADITTEQVLETGQKLQYGGTVTIEGRRPTGLRIAVNSDAQSREYYYDGKALTIVSPRLKFYATVPAAPSIGRMLDNARTRYGLELPLTDLFTWGTDQSIRARVREAYVIRPEMIGGRSCMHYAFRQELVDWQIWIEEAPSARPCKMVITNTADPAQPQYVALLEWRDAPIDPAAFVFRPGADMRKITIVDASKGAGK